MSLKEQAEIARHKLGDMMAIIQKMNEVVDAVLEVRVFGDKTFEFSTEQKQSMMQEWQALKTQLQTKLEELP